MKTFLLRLLSLSLVLMPMAAAAQTSIKSAFDAIINCPDATVTDSHEFEKDPSTFEKTGQYDSYKFELPAGKMKLVKDLFAAFRKDSDKSYGIYNGKAAKNDSAILMACGDGTGAGVRVNPEGREYIYGLFMAPKSEDPDGKYRYAYAANYEEKDGKIIGRLIVTYALTLKYRQDMQKYEKALAEQRFWDRSNGNEVTVIKESNRWFDKVMQILQNMPSAKKQTRISLATQTLKLCQSVSKYQEVTAEEKDIIRNLLKAMTDDFTYQETILNNLLQQCLSSLK